MQRGASVLTRWCGVVRFITTLVIVPVFLLLALRLAPLSGDVSMVARWFDPRFVLTPLEPEFLGPFTADATFAPRVNVATFLVKTSITMSTTLLTKRTTILAIMYVLFCSCGCSSWLDC